MCNSLLTILHKTLYNILIPDNKYYKGDLKT